MKLKATIKRVLNDTLSFFSSDDTAGTDVGKAYKISNEIQRHIPRRTGTDDPRMRIVFYGDPVMIPTLRKAMDLLQNKSETVFGRTVSPEFELLPREEQPAGAVKVKSIRPGIGFEIKEAKRTQCVLTVKGSKSLSGKAEYLIGRNEEGSRHNDIDFPDKRVSRLQARIRLEYGNWILKSQSNASSTYLITPDGQEIELRENDRETLKGEGDILFCKEPPHPGVHFRIVEV